MAWRVRYCKCTKPPTRMVRLYTRFGHGEYIEFQPVAMACPSCAHMELLERVGPLAVEATFGATCRVLSFSTGVSGGDRA